jgi:hypothetical protein
MAIDAKTRKLLEQLLEGARKNGQDALEVLNRFGYVLHPAKRKAIELETLKDVWQRLDAQHASSILQVFTGKNSGTPEDMYRAILDWVEAVHKEREAQP